MAAEAERAGDGSVLADIPATFVSTTASTVAAMSAVGSAKGEHARMAAVIKLNNARECIMWWPLTR